jgi:hypothetical protein
MQQEIREKRYLPPVELRIRAGPRQQRRHMTRRRLEKNRYPASK